MPGPDQTQTTGDGHLDGAGSRGGPGGYAALKGVGRAMQILGALAERPMRAKELSEHLGLKWTTAYRSLAYLEEHGYLALNPETGAYSVGPHLYRLGSSYLVSHPLAQAAPPHLKLASEEMKCASQVNEREGLRVITIASTDAPISISKVSLGFSFPLHVSSKGQLLLAHAPPEVQEAAMRPENLTVFTKHSITDPKRLLARLEEIRSASYAVTRDDIQIGVGSAAAPIRNADNDVIACATLIVRAARMGDPAYVDRLVAAVSEAATSLSLAIGWRAAGVPVR